MQFLHRSSQPVQVGPPSVHYAIGVLGGPAVLAMLIDQAPSIAPNPESVQAPPDLICLCVSC